MNKASELVTIYGQGRYLETIRRCGGFYQCPKNRNNGKRLGPLVGYAGKYQAGDGSQKQWVGETYVNFAKAEEYPFVLRYFAEEMENKLKDILDSVDVFCGAPLGGYDFAQMLGLVCDRRVIKAEKKVIALATDDMREQSAVIFGRSKLKQGDNVAIVEDVCNNFSTSDKLIGLIENSGGKAVAIICFLRHIRLLYVDDWYTWYASMGEMRIPIVHLISLQIPEYKQDHPFVADDIRAGNVVWKPKDEWHRLM